MLFSAFIIDLALLLQSTQSLARPLAETTTYALTVIEETTIPHIFENVAARYDGDLLVTSINSPVLYQVSPVVAKAPAVVAVIPDATSLLGIAELEQDVFYVIASNLTTLPAAPGSNAVWKVDFNDRSCAPGTVDKTHATASLVAQVSTAATLNGMCRLAKNDTSTLLMADSTSGDVVRLDVNTGSYEVVMDDMTMENGPSGLQIAIDGLHMHDSYLYFTDLNQGIFARIPVSLTDAHPTGPVEIIVNGTAGDDFVISEDGKKAWVAMNGQSKLVEIDIPRRDARVVVESTYLASASAVAFGRTRLDDCSLYISSGGELDPNSNSTGTGGLVVRVDL
ncbi:uncharacterized protein BHQ10_003677 [Talaromyces amestolkiae]|uniref:SMP-30/Gluconolactonase/LRE-like region domain-containing protein n=1 Tax=Talaromyces amestolkiae TaxID=1196081 RepID=A0A364KVT0_TALAM|nr:uncharacterized protein BHQ10_003677 [Talaromyces amestolkiae]RAO67665.1 hypothetical protein BHQ10_003677 [Talaromyces amestolkiae]